MTIPSSLRTREREQDRYAPVDIDFAGIEAVEDDSPRTVGDHRPKAEDRTLRSDYTTRGDTMLRPDRNPRGHVAAWWTLPLAVTLAWTASPVSAQTTSNLCALLPEADVSAVVGTQVKLESPPPPVAGTPRLQQCIYGTPRGGKSPTTVRVIFEENTSATVAAQSFQTGTVLLDARRGKKGQPLSGIGDEALAYPMEIMVRKHNMVAHIAVGTGSTMSPKELEQSKQLAQKAAAHIK